MYHVRTGSYVEGRRFRHRLPPWRFGGGVTENHDRGRYGTAEFPDYSAWNHRNFGGMSQHTIKTSEVPRHGGKGGIVVDVVKTHDEAQFEWNAHGAYTVWKEAIDNDHQAGPPKVTTSFSLPCDGKMWVRHNVQDSGNLSSWIDCNVSNRSMSELGDFRIQNPLLGVVLATFALVTILGNALVIVAVAKERYLRKVTNYFIVSLALADLVIGSLVMPFSIFMELSSHVWIFGQDWCDVWHSIDVLASTASILNLSVISLDRYWAITDPIAYPSKMSTGRAFVMIALIWICSAAISFPAILWWRAVLTDPLSPKVCAFTEDPAYLIFSSMVSFYFPMTIIIFAYYKIYRAAREQLRSLTTGSKVMNSHGVNGEVMMLRIHRGGAPKSVRYSRARANSDSDDPDTENESPIRTPARPSRDSGAVEDMRPSRVMSRKLKHFAISRKLSKVAKEQKAAKTLGIVMGVFCMCWVPFFVTNILYGFCKLDCVRHAHIVFPVFTWLGYLNSGMNPVIYACSMRDFRRAFANIVCACCPGSYRFRARCQQYESSFSTSSLGGPCGGERYSNVRL